MAQFAFGSYLDLETALYLYPSVWKYTWPREGPLISGGYTYENTIKWDLPVNAFPSKLY